MKMLSRGVREVQVVPGKRFRACGRRGYPMHLPARERGLFLRRRRRRDRLLSRGRAKIWRFEVIADARIDGHEKWWSLREAFRF
jgi:hypothetical protein